MKSTFSEIETFHLTEPSVGTYHAMGIGSWRIEDENDFRQQKNTRFKFYGNLLKELEVFWKCGKHLNWNLDAAQMKMRIFREKSRRGDFTNCENKS